MKQASHSTCGKTFSFSAHRSILGRALVILALVSIAISLQPATATAQDWQPTEAPKIQLQELSATFDQWLEEHRASLYYDIIEGRDPRYIRGAAPATTSPAPARPPLSSASGKPAPTVVCGPLMNR